MPLDLERRGTSVPRLSVTIIACDEEPDLPACLASVAFADEIVVVDSGSRDRTREVARAAGARVLERPFDGFAAQKQFALEQATGDWVLNLDADERCSEELAAALGPAMAQEGVDGYQVRFQTWLFGRRARFGGLARERHLRLFRRAGSRYPPRAVHEGVEVAGEVRALEAPIRHYTYRSLAEYLEKINRYTSAAARERYAAGRRFSRWSALRAPWGFFRRYLLQLGFLDGWAGLVFAAMGGLYDFLKEAKLADLERERGEPPERAEGP
jgi:glycosyltransferase involved in cell wall biosynthesis